MLPASVSLHPVASRNGHQSSTIVQVQVDPVNRSALQGQQERNHAAEISPADGTRSQTPAPTTANAASEGTASHAAAAAAAASASQALAQAVQPGSAVDGSTTASSRPTLHRSPHSSSAAAPSTAHTPAERVQRQSLQNAAFGSASAAHTTGDAALDSLSFNRFAPNAMPEAQVWGIEHPDLSIYPVVGADCAAGTPGAENMSSDPAAANRKRATSTASAPPAEVVDIAFTRDGQAHDDVPPLRKMSATQFADLFARYAATDVPHAVVFPFMHGVDGENYEQNIFFGAPLSGMPTPKYRGLTIVRANMPTAQQRSLLPRRQRARKSSHYSQSIRSRADSVITTASESSNNHSAGNSSDGHDSSNRQHFGSASSMPNSNVSSSHSISSHGGTSIFSHRSGHGNASVGSMNSIGSMTTVEDGFFADVPKPGQRGSSISSGSGAPGYHAIARPYEPQPSHSLLVSSVFPGELISVPATARSSSKRDSSASSSSRSRSNSTNQKRTTFVKPRQADGVSLRNFKIQCARYATISDIVIYCPAGLHEGMLELGDWFREAQNTKWEERQARGLGGLRYNVFLVEDPFDAFEESFPELVAVDSIGNSVNRVDFAEREREEMQRLSKANEIDTNVWVGSSADVPHTDCPAFLQDSTDEFDAKIETELSALNPQGFAVCIEAHESGEMPTPARLANAAAYLNSLEDSLRARQEWNESANGTPLGDDEMSLEKSRSSLLSLGPKGWTPPLRRLSHRARGKSSRSPQPTDQATNTPDVSIVLPPESMVLLSCSTFSDVHQYNAPFESLLADQMIDLADWIKTQAGPSSKSDTQHTRGSKRAGEQEHPPRRVLLHCGDGYTETSVIALTYIMYARRLSLPEAYLYLQNTANRSFFVYPKELPFLRKIEAKIRQRFEEKERTVSSSTDRPKHTAWSSGPAEDQQDSSSAQQDERGHSDDCAASDDEMDQPPMPEKSGWSRSLVAAASGLVSAIPSGGHKRNNSMGSSTTSKAGDSSLRVKTPTPTSPQLQPTLARKSPEERFPWFYTKYFEGSFPSRILPFLYLGNLNHALNAPMLHALGITHVVSVGESALTPPAGNAITICTPSDTRTTVSTAAKSEHSLWHEERAGRINVLDLKNVSDDGIDPLRAAMKQACDRIEECRRMGGNVLVHCRVGVSRSSTIVIAYAMAHLDLSFVESYLLVRSRRLNILIQPHLLFCFELLSWQHYLTSVKDKRRQALACNLRKGLESGGDTIMHDAFQDARRSLSSLSLDHQGNTSQDHKTLRDHRLSAGVDDDLDVDIGAGAGSAHSVKIDNVAIRPFGSGSPTALPNISTRLTWGFLAREIAQLNERYFVS